MSFMYLGQNGVYTVDIAQQSALTNATYQNPQMMSYGGLLGGMSNIASTSLNQLAQAYYPQSDYVQQQSDLVNLMARAEAKKVASKDEMCIAHNMTKFERWFRQRWKDHEATPSSLLLRLRYEIEKWHHDPLDRSELLPA